MANKVKGMLQIRRILQLLEESRSKRSISRDMGISRNTVDYYEQRVKVSYIFRSIPTHFRIETY